MKKILPVVCLVIILTLIYTGQAGQEPPEQEPVSAVLHDTLSFEKDIQPVLQQNCSPCHFEGGKMYTAMPFDKAVTIVSHADGALKRFSNEKENALIKEFIRQRKLN